MIFAKSPKGGSLVTKDQDNDAWGDQDVEECRNCPLQWGKNFGKTFNRARDGQFGHDRDTSTWNIAYMKVLSQVTGLHNSPSITM